MDKQAAEALGEPVISSCILLESGATKKMRKNMAPMGGAIGIAAVAVANKLKNDDSVEPEMTAYAGSGYLALTPSRLALFAVESGFLKQKLGEQLASFLPGELDRIIFGKAAAGVGTIKLITTEGQRYTFEYSKVGKRKLARIAEASQALVIDE
jgi:hypothetical protein